MSPPKVVITTVPLIEEDTPLAAPAVLKSSLQANGIDCVGLDLNIEIYNKIQTSPNRRLFLDFFFNQNIHEEIVDDLVGMLDFYAREILFHKPDIVGLSLFSYHSQAFTPWLCAMLKHRAPHVKIVIGGPGLQTLENAVFKFPDRIKRLGLIDDYITGDAEASLVEYVKGNLSYPGINSLSWQPNKDFTNLPLPDFSDYRFFRYKYPLLPLVDSRGCVQSCEFCDVISFWEKFQYLSAESIFSQMLKLIEEYNVYRFQFASSICNGNFREFKKLLALMVDHNRTHSPVEQIHWIGSFIIRPAKQHKEEIWQAIKESNGYLLTAVESVVEHVRVALGKRFSNEDLEHHLVMCKKYKIPMNLLMIAAYHTETDEDYEYVLQWFRDHKDYVNDTIMQVQVTTLGILPGTKLEKNIDKEIFNKNGSKRMAQARAVMEVLNECGFTTRLFF